MGDPISTIIYLLKVITDSADAEHESIEVLGTVKQVMARIYNGMLTANMPENQQAAALTPNDPTGRIIIGVSNIAAMVEGSNGM